MKVKDLKKALENLNPEADVVINIKQSNKAYGFQLPISYGSQKPDTEIKSGEYHEYFNSWVNNSYGGSITIHLPDGAYVCGLPEGNKPV